MLSEAQFGKTPMTAAESEPAMGAADQHMEQGTHLGMASLRRVLGKYQHQPLFTVDNVTSVLNGATIPTPPLF